MSQTAITLAFEQWKANQAVTGEPVLLDEFVFANVPGLNTDKAIDRNEGMPPAAQIVHRQAVSRKGVVNENAVVHSVVLGADVGDFSFNWVGLINKASNTLAMIVHAPLQQKLKTKDGQQGNVLTRSFLMEYNGAQTETGINTPAETWQIDFTARMAGMDERQRLENIDLYGAAAFLGDGWLVAKSGTQFYVTAGAGYVRGLRALLAANQNITVTTKPVKVWLDVAWTGTLTSAWAVNTKITVAASLADYVQNGVQHYVFAVASIDANGNITDLRPKGTLNDQTASDALAKHEQSRNHPDGSLTAKGFVQLSSSVTSDSEGLAATPKGVKIANENAKAANDNANTRLPLAGGWLTGGFGIKTTIGSVSFGVGSSDVYISNGASNKFLQLKHTGELKYDDKAVYHEGYKPTADDVGALPVKGTAEAAKKLATARKIAGVAFDGTSDISLKVTSLDDAGTSVTKDATTSDTDRTDGRLTTVGWMGLGSVSGLSFSDANTPDFNCFFRMSSDGIHGVAANAPANILQFQYDKNAGQQVGFRAGQANAAMHHRTKTNAVWGDWIQVFDTLHPPTAAQVGALSLGGGKVSGDLEISSGAPLIKLSETDTGKQYFLVVDASEFRIQEDSTSGNRILAYGGASKILSTTGQLVPGNYSNFDGRFYTKTLAEQTFQPKGSYGKPNTYGISGNVMWWKCGETGVIRISGVTANVSNSGRVAFPLTFPNKCFSVVANRNHESGDSAAMQPYSVDTTGFNLRIAGGGTATITWIAEGR